eukprot:129059-Prymnesium_polylepis.1
MAPRKPTPAAPAPPLVAQGTAGKKRTPQSAFDGAAGNSTSRTPRSLPCALDLKLLKWWAAKESKWPNLAKMVKQYLAAPASSAGVERVFSAAGNNDLRKSAIEETLEHSISAAFNCG